MNQKLAFIITVSVLCLPNSYANSSDVFSCSDSAGDITYAAESIAGSSCEKVGQLPPSSYVMIYQDSLQQIFVEVASVSRKAHVSDVTTVVNYRSEPSRGGDASTVRSLLRRQTFDCRVGGGVALLEEHAFSRPLARGKPASSIRAPNAVHRALVAGSTDEVVREVLCREPSN